LPLAIWRHNLTRKIAGPNAPLGLLQECQLSWEKTGPPQLTAVDFRIEFGEKIILRSLGSPNLFGRSAITKQHNIIILTRLFFLVLAKLMN
jgi:hypothetical protein